MEITQMITLSTGHLSEETREKMELAADPDGKSPISNVTVYNKDHYGWFAYIDLDSEGSYEETPEDLRNVIKFALNLKCQLICFDVDGPEVDNLTVYESNEN